MSTTKHDLVRVAGLLSASAALLVAGSGVAGAHVTVTTQSAAAGTTALLSFSTSHGCDGSPTTKVAIKVPAGINTVAPTVNPGWTVTKTSRKLATPVQDQHGTTLTERVDQVVYVAKTPLADGFRDVLTVAVPLPEDAAGQVLAFPVVQTCTKGRTAWVEQAADGQNPDELEHPAPSITVGSADAEAADHHDAAAAGEAHHDPAEGPDGGVSTEITTAGGGAGRGWGVAGLVAGLAGLALGAFAVFRGRQAAT
jgi:uncharacterized protein YcnI